MEVTDDGMVTEAREEQPKNALARISVIPSGMTKSSTNLPFKYSLPLNNGFALELAKSILHQLSNEDIWTKSKEVQLLNASDPIEVTDAGMVTEVSLLHL